MNISLDQPFSSISKAYGKIFREIKSRGGDLESEIGEEIYNALGGEVGSLVQSIPELDDIRSKFSMTSHVTMKSERKMTEETQLLLQQEACFGPDFTTPTLTIVWHNTQQHPSSHINAR